MKHFPKGQTGTVIAVAIVIVIILALGGYLYLRSPLAEPPSNSPTTSTSENGTPVETTTPEDKPEVKPDGAKVMPNGTIIRADGVIIAPDGTMSKPENP